MFEHENMDRKDVEKRFRDNIVMAQPAVQKEVEPGTSRTPKSPMDSQLARLPGTDSIAHSLTDPKTQAQSGRSKTVIAKSTEAPIRMS